MRNNMATGRRIGLILEKGWSDGLEVCPKKENMPDGIDFDEFATVADGLEAFADARFAKRRNAESISDVIVSAQYMDVDWRNEFIGRLRGIGADATIADVVRTFNEVEKEENRKNVLETYSKDVRKRLALEGLSARGFKIVPEGVLWQFLNDAEKVDGIEDLKNLELRDYVRWNGETIKAPTVSAKTETKKRTAKADGTER